MNFFSHIKRLPIALAGTLVLSQAHAMVALEEEEMSGVSGAGLAFVFDNFSMRMAPTSFIELTGTAPSAGWQRGDARYYGLSITDGEGLGGTDWYGNGCSTGSAIAGALGCPIGNSNPNNDGITKNIYGIGAAASVYDPYLLRVFQYPGHDYDGGAYLNNSAPGTATTMPTILELVGPSQTDAWRWSFWGELEIDRDVGQPSANIGAVNCSLGGPDCADFLQSQTIIRGKPVTADGKPSIFRLMRTTGRGVGNDTLGLTYQSAISGDMRFSVRQQGGSPDALHVVPDFNDVEGLYFKNVDAFLPIGALHYQTIVLDASPDNSGNFTIELTRIPNIAAVYNNFYCGAINNNNANGCTDASGVITSPNENTRGYVRWGNWTEVNVATGAGLPAANATNNGIYFAGGTLGAETVTNIGISRIEGMRIQHLKITSLGASL